MIRHVVILVIVFSAVLLGAAPAGAQYMFLDFNGDGQYTYADGFGARDTADVDLYVVTDRNSDGSAATCNGRLQAYTVNLMAHADPVTFLSVVNRMPEMYPLDGIRTYPYALYATFVSNTSFPGGRYRVLSMRIVFTGCPNLEIVSSSCYSPYGSTTGLALSCAEDMVPVEGLGAWGCTDIGPHQPTVSAPANVNATIGQPISFYVLVGAPDCSLHSFYGYDLPPGAALSALSPIRNGFATASFSWIPTAGQEGTYAVHFEASNPDPFNMSDGRTTDTTTITVGPVPPTNRAPEALAGGPYRGIQGVPVAFDGRNSSDPEGASLTYAWQFGDGANGSGPRPLHTYDTGGIFGVTLRVTDPGGLFDEESTSATILRDIPVRVFTSASNDPTRLGRGKPQTCFQIESTDGSFTPDQLLPASIFLHFTDPVCGDLEVYSLGTKTATVTDSDKNGVSEFAACFSREAMQTLGECMPQGANTVTLQLNGALATGERIHGQVEHTFLSNGPLQIAITPNPVNAASAIGFTTRRTGPITVRVFDIRGRLAATLLEESNLPAGRHQISFANLGSEKRLATGIYFVRVSAPGNGDETRRITVLR